MLDTAPILWLQEWASPALTRIMLAVSVCGYVPSCLAVAIVCGLGWRLRLGMTLILAIVFADAITAAAKASFASPRPFAVDARVQALGAFESDLPRLLPNTWVPDDDFGFPSGHVATTAAWALGLVWSRRKRWPMVAAGTWIGLMAFSRMYLGRHFPADVVGGLLVGAAGLALAHRERPRTTLGVSLAAVVGLATLSGAGLGAHDAGRFCGLVGAVLLLMRTPPVDSIAPATRVARMGIALVLLGVALWSSTWTITAGPTLAVVSRMAVSAALHACVLLVPVLAIGRQRP